MDEFIVASHPDTYTMYSDSDIYFVRNIYGVMQAAKINPTLTYDQSVQ